MKKAAVLLIVIFSFFACGKEEGDGRKSAKYNGGKTKPYKQGLVKLGKTVHGWPSFQGPDRNGIARVTGINKNWKVKKPKTLWSVNLKDDGYACPSAAEGMVFIQDRRWRNHEKVRAINIQTGKDVWSFSYADPGYARYGYARATPVYDEGLLYTISRNGRLHCLEAKNGKKLWTMDIIKKYGGELPRWQMAISPLIDGQRLIVCSPGKKNLIMLDKKNGKEIMKAGNDDGISYATPVIAIINGIRQYIFFTPESLIGIGDKDGKVLWRFPWKSRRGIHVAQPLVVSKNRIFITTGYKKGCAMVEVKGNNTKQLWFTKNMQAHFSSPILYKGFIYGNSDPDHLVCLNPADGSVKWKKKGFQKGGLILADEVLIALGGQSGSLIMVKAVPNTYQELGRIKPAGGRSWTPPIMSDKNLIIRNRTQLMCISLD